MTLSACSTLFAACNIGPPRVVALLEERVGRAGLTEKPIFLDTKYLMSRYITRVHGANAHRGVIEAMRQAPIHRRVLQAEDPNDVDV
jgi:hypothetical protein